MLPIGEMGAPNAGFGTNYRLSVLVVTLSPSFMLATTLYLVCWNHKIISYVLYMCVFSVFYCSDAWTMNRIYLMLCSVVRTLDLG